MRVHLVVALVFGAIACAAASPAYAADSSSSDPSISSTATTWSDASGQLGAAGSLWQPTYTAHLTMSRPIDVEAVTLTFVNGAVAAGSRTSAGAAYGTSTFGFTLDQKWATTDWAVAPTLSWQTAPVGTVKIRLGLRGNQVKVRATVSANCLRAKPDKTATILEQLRGLHCTKADVLRYGGVLDMTAKPPSQMSGQGSATIHIETVGLSYAELVAVASGLKQVSGGPDTMGSAQMRALCRQMVDGTMTPGQADALAKANGYVTRVGSVNGEEQVLTMDFRADRFTLSIIANAVGSCTYG